MTAAEVRRHLEFALEAVLAAGPIALEHFRRPIPVDDKRKHGRYDPVTEADRGIETFLRERLRSACPGHGIVGEEHGTEGQGSTYWVIDPIDGTRAFISGLPTWGILLGLVEEGRPLLGVVHQPFTGETWYAAAGCGARFRLRDRDVELRTRADATLADAVLYSTHPSMFRDPSMLARYEDLAGRCRLQRWGGDCYAFALVAHGGIDLMVDAELAPYDILPLVPIIEEAGGVVTDLEGRTPLAGGTVVAAANRALHGAALAIMSGRGERP
jgi:histidinol phosphatase-like enzyme (inositol monophosphatase family)